MESSRKFRPIGKRDTSDQKSIVARVPKELYDKVQDAAKKHRCTIQEFAEQSLEYALREMVEE